MKNFSKARLLSSWLILPSLMCCSNQSPDIPQLAYSQQDRVLLAASNVSIIFIPESDTFKDDIAKQADIVFKADVEKWAYNRFVARGGPDQALITVQSAKIDNSSSHKPSTASHDYTGVFDVKLEILDAKGTVKARVGSAINQNLNLGIAAPPHTIEQEIKAMSKQMINTLDAHLVKQIYKNRSMYLTN